MLNARGLVPRQRTAFERARAHAATLLRDQEKTSLTGISKALLPHLALAAQPLAVAVAVAVAVALALPLTLTLV